MLEETSAGTGRVEQRRARTRREILDAAWSLCHEQGLAALSLRELAGRVGMRAPSLYSYFDAKEAIDDAMFADGQRQFADRIAQLPEDGPARRTLKQGTRLFADFCTSDVARYQLMFQRPIPGFEPSAEAYALAEENLEALGRHLVAMGVTEPHLLDLWTAISTGLVDQQISNDPGGDRWTRLIDEAADLFCDHAGVPPDPPEGEPT
mgnify:CR=1 FL=1